MADNSILTPDEITRESLRILHQKLFFLKNIYHHYDDSFANSGAKIGDKIRIRLPNQYKVREGKTLKTQGTTEQSVTLTVARQRGVDLEFSSAELALDIDDFSQRFIEPAMSKLAAYIEADALSMYADIYQAVDNAGSSATLRSLLMGRKQLTDALAPTSMRCLQIDTQSNVDLVDGLKGLFQDSSTISEQYKEGLVGRTASYGSIYENTLLPRHSVGTANGYLVNGAVTEGGNTIPVDAGTGTLNAGDIITFAGVNRVHPETKEDTGNPQQFVITEDYAGGAGTISVSPALIADDEDAYKNISALPADNAVISTFATAGQAHDMSLAFHKEAFAFASVDLPMPDGVDFKSRQMYEGISMRIVRAYNITEDEFPCRIDVLYGYKTIRPELATRILTN